MWVAVEPAPAPLLLNAVTCTSKGEFVLSVYVWLGVLSDVAVVVSPSPQSIVYLFALPVAFIVSVTLNGLPPSDTLVVKLTSLTYVLFCIFHIVSLRVSIDSATDVELLKATAPDLVTDEFPSYSPWSGVINQSPSPSASISPNVILNALLLTLATLASNWALVTASVETVALAILKFDNVLPSSVVTCNALVNAFATRRGPFLPNCKSVETPFWP